MLLALLAARGAAALSIPPSASAPVRLPLARRAVTRDDLHQLTNNDPAAATAGDDGAGDTGGGGGRSRLRALLGKLSIPWEAAEYQGREANIGYEYFTEVTVVEPTGGANATAQLLLDTGSSVTWVRGAGFQTGWTDTDKGGLSGLSLGSTHGGKDTCLALGYGTGEFAGVVADLSAAGAGNARTAFHLEFGAVGAAAGAAGAANALDSGPVALAIMTRNLSPVAYQGRAACAGAGVRCQLPAAQMARTPKILAAGAERKTRTRR